MMTENLTDKDIKAFTSLDTIYISKNESGFQITYFCQFVKIERGIVTGKIISVEPNPSLHEHKKGREISGRLSKCYLYGKENNLGRAYCHWFENGKAI